MTVNESQAELYVPVRSGFGQNEAGTLDPAVMDAHWRRTTRAWEEWAKSPFVTNAKIQNATITSAKIESLSADKITAGTITSEVIISGTVYAPSDTGWRVEIGDALLPIRYWDGTTTNFSLDNGGSVVMTGEINATSGSITGNLLVTGLIQAPSTTGFRVEIGDSTFPLRYWDGTTTMLSLSDVGNVVARDIDVRQSATGGPAFSMTGINTSGGTIVMALYDSAGRPYFRTYNNGDIRLNDPTDSTAGQAVLHATNQNKAVACDGQLIGLDGVVTAIVAGAGASDADFDNPPANGTLAISNNAGTRKLHLRVGGNWYSVVVS